MRRWTALVGLVAALAMAGSAVAGEPGAKKKGRGKGTKETGTFVSAAVDAETITWKLTAEDGTEKTYTMPAEVIVMFAERNEKKIARGIGPKGKKEPKVKGKAKLCIGTFLGKAESAGNRFTMTVNGKILTADAADAGEAADHIFTMSTKLVVMTRERRGETMVMRITAARGPRKAKGDKPAGEKKARKKGGRKNKGDAPENM